jgi:hypothetical protein
MNRHVSLTLALAAALAAGCSAKGKKAETEKEGARPPVTFTHKIHVDQGLECTQCHPNIAKSNSLADANLPTTAVCKDCHDDKKAPPESKEPPRLTFSHAWHLPIVKNKCDTCHKQLPEPGEERAVPPMATCTGCHNHQKDFAAARCTPCHVDLKSFPLEPKSAFAHVGQWIVAHGSYARTSVESCANCHDQTYCAECHDSQTTPMRLSVRFPEEVQRDFIHRGDYVSRHMIDAQANPASCARCHGTAFCSSCHTLQGLTTQANPANLRNPHPSGWTAKDQHGRAARNNVLACAACHDNGADAICVTCHRPGGVGGNPHPQSFLSKRSGDDQHKGVCRACHG